MRTSPVLLLCPVALALNNAAIGVWHAFHQTLNVGGSDYVLGNLLQQRNCLLDGADPRVMAQPLSEGSVQDTVR